MWKIITKKQCTWCNQTKLLSEFYSKEKFKRSGEAYIYYHPECKQCSINRSKKWKSKNKESVRISNVKYNNSDRRRYLKKIFMSREEPKLKYRNWQRLNKDKIKNYRLSRQIKTHNISSLEWENCKLYFNHCCAYCGLDESTHKEINKQQLHQEHVIHDGRNDLKNCVPSCKSCNGIKNIRTVNHFFNNSELFTRDRYLKIYQWLRFDVYKYLEKK